MNRRRPSTEMFDDPEADELEAENVAAGLGYARRDRTAYGAADGKVVGTRNSWDERPPVAAWIPDAGRQAA